MSRPMLTTARTRLDVQRHVASNDICFVYFTAEWCGPCRRLKPVLTNLPGVKVVEVDVDRADEDLVSDTERVPTVQAWVDGRRVDTVRGDDVPRVLALHRSCTRACDARKK